MQNLVKNQHGTFTLRRSFGSQSLRVSLKTANEVDAKLVYYRLQELLPSHPLLTADEVKNLIKTLLADKYGNTAMDSRSRLVALLNNHLHPNQYISLSELFSKYRDEKVRSKSWRSNTEVLANDHISLLTNMLGNVPVNLIDQAMALRVKETLQKLPSHARKKRVYRSKSLDELASMVIPTDDLMSVSTINMKLSFYSEVFSWSLKHGLVDSNPFTGIQLKDGRNAQSLRLPFTILDLNKIFSAPQIVDSHVPYRFWLPVLALYTGARINELCQLYLDDVVTVDGISCIHIRSDRSGQSLKTSSSKRIIPIHTDIVDLGFIDFLDELRQSGHRRLFEELVLNRKKFSVAASKWFSRIKPKILPEADARHCFHSFRHNFTENLVDTNGWGLDPAVKVLLGHQNSDITTGLYGAVASLDRLKVVIDSLSWKELGVRISKAD